ncbi:MAG TPA: Hsp70 family protein, partial [Vicinamibacteria bacterium]|nr:Hsp70 family protein [Vicinamibacteria bacterium]
STAADNQPEVTINVLQGERPMARDNRLLGTFNLQGIAPAPRGMPQIEVTFDIDANGIVNVSAKDRATGKSQAITITASSGLAKEEVERMVSDAQSHTEDDKKRREEIEARNRADSLVYTTEKTLAENKDKLPPADVEAAEKALEAARKAIQAGGAEAIQSATADLTKASHKLAEALYRQASAGGPGGAGTGGGAAEGAPPGAEGGKKDGGDGDVIDAEVVEPK